MGRSYQRNRQSPKFGHSIRRCSTPLDFPDPRVNIRVTQVPKAPTDALRALEQTATSVVSAIMNEQAASQGLGLPATLSISATTNCRIALPSRGITLSELQRLKRQFVTIHKKAITLGTTEKGAVDWSEESMVQKFATYLEENLKS